MINCVPGAMAQYSLKVDTSGRAGKLQLQAEKGGIEIFMIKSKSGIRVLSATALQLLFSTGAAGCVRD